MLKLNSKNIFLVDGLGALSSAICLGIVLVHFQSLIGMPVESLYLLAAIAICLSAYSMICHLVIRVRQQTFLKALILFNCTYILLSVLMVYLHFAELKIWGLLYFAIEIAIIGLIVYVEYNSLDNLN